MLTLDKLPIELKLLILQEEDTQLKYTNREYYKLSNLVAKKKVSRIIPIDNIVKPLFKRYEASLKFFNGALSELLLPELNYDLYYSFLKNRRIYFEPKCCRIQPANDNHNSGLRPFEFINGSLKINHVQAFIYEKRIIVPPGVYNFEVALINHRFCTGLGTTNFIINDLFTGIRTRLHPTIYLNELMPVSGINIANLGILDLQGDKEREVIVTIEELGQNSKTNLEFLFFQFNPFINQFNNDYMFYTIDREDNLIERLNYMAIQDSQPSRSDCDFLVNETQDPVNYEQYYTSGERSFKMLFPSDQRIIREKKSRIPIRPWKVPF